MPELARRYVVMPLATDAPFDPADPDGVFVLKPWKDPAALRALRAYRDSCFPELRRDLDAWIRAIEAGPTVRGDVGRRNEAFARVAPPVVAPAAAPASMAAPRKPTPAGVARPATPSPRGAVRKRPAASARTVPGGKRTPPPRPPTGEKRSPATKARPTTARRPAPKKPARKRRR